MDLVADVEEQTVLQPGEIKLVPTGISISIPTGYEAEIRPRSGLALKHGIIAGQHSRNHRQRLSGRGFAHLDQSR